MAECKPCHERHLKGALWQFSCHICNKMGNTLSHQGGAVDIRALQQTVARQGTTIQGLEQAVDRQGTTIHNLQQTVAQHVVTIQGLEQAVDRQAAMNTQLVQHGLAHDAQLAHVRDALRTLQDRYDAVPHNVQQWLTERKMLTCNGGVSCKCAASML